MLVYQEHYESASFALEARVHRHPEIRILPPIVGPCGERASHVGHGIRKRIAVRAARAASDAKKTMDNGGGRLTHCPANIRRATESQIMLISQERYEIASSRAATLISCSTVGLVASSASRRLFGLLFGAYSSSRAIHGSARLQGIGAQIDDLANECS